MFGMFEEQQGVQYRWSKFRRLQGTRPAEQDTHRSERIGTEWKSGVRGGGKTSMGVCIRLHTLPFYTAVDEIDNSELLTYVFKAFEELHMDLTKRRKIIY